MKAIIIAGGLGTRLRPLTYNRPKPIVSMMNKPFVVHQLELLKKHGINEIVLNLHYMPKNMEYILGDGSKFGVKLFYSIEKQPLGTAGAVKNAEQYFDNDPLVILNGDTLTDINISEVIAFHKKNKAVATLTLTNVEDPTHYGLVITGPDGRIKSFLEKPNWEQVAQYSTKTINAGIYVLDPAIFKDVPENTVYSFERQLFPKILESGQNFYSVTSDAYWMDIGSPQKYMQAHRDILNGEVPFNMIEEKKDNNKWVGKNAKIDPSVRLKGPLVIGEKSSVKKSSKINPFTVIGDNVNISENAFLEDCVILRNCRIGQGVKIKNCIIGENCIIEDDVEMVKGIVLADYSIIKRGSMLL